MIDTKTHRIQGWLEKDGKRLSFTLITNSGNDIRKAMQAVNTLAVGGVMINDTPTFRLDHFPYGGNKRSGLCREGVRFAIDDMTTIKMVVINHN